MIGVLSLDCTLVLTRKILECDVQVSMYEDQTFHVFMLTMCIRELVDYVRMVLT